jgi:parallel beta-helix repeat protein
MLPFQGGLIRLAEGEYHPDWDRIKLPNSGQVTIQGSGYGTIIDMNDTNPSTGTGPVFEVVAGTGHCQFKDMQIWGPSNGTSTQVAIETNGQHTRITNVFFSFFQGDTVQITSLGDTTVIEGCGFEGCERAAVDIVSADRVRIINCWITASSTPATEEYLIAALSSDNLLIANCYIFTAQNAISVTAGDHLVIADSLITGDLPIYLNRCTDVVIEGNTIDSNETDCILADSVGAGTEHGPLVITGNTLDTGGITLDAQFEFTITGNTMRNSTVGGIYVTASFEGSVRANDIHFVTEHGILLDDVTSTACQDNLIVEAGQGTSNTWDGIHLSGLTEHLLCTGNKVVSDSGQTRYGINDTTDLCNYVAGNALTSNFGTDFLNPGALTQLFWPADATYGDNFTGCGST